MAKLNNIYAKELRKFRPVKNSIELVERARSGDTKARDTLLKAHMLYAAHVALMWANNLRMEPDDLVQEANVGLLKAIEKYPLGTGIPFHVVAYRYMCSTIEHYLCENYWNIRIQPVHYKIYKQWKQSEGALDVFDLADMNNVTVNKASKIFEMHDLYSLDMPDPFTDKTIDTPDPDTVSPEDDHEEEKRKVDFLLSKLTRTERNVIEARYGFGDPANFDQSYEGLASTFGVTASALNRRHKVAIQKLRRIIHDAETKKKSSHK